MLAKALSEKLGYDVVGREEVVKDASQFDASQEELREALLKPPTIGSRLTHSRRRYLAFVQFALCQRIQTGNVIYHGNAGHLLLRGIPHLFCVRLIAPLTFRLEQVMKKQDMSRDDAMKYIEKVDHEREAWTRLVYGVNYLDPHLYDLVVNLKALTVTTAVEMVAHAVQQPEFAITDDGRNAVADLLLGSRVRAVLAADKTTASTEVKVEAKGGCVFLSGRLHSGSLVESVLEIASRVEGVESINRDNLDAPEYTV